MMLISSVILVHVSIYLTVHVEGKVS